MITLSKLQRQQVIDHLFTHNGTQYNMHKASEELTELALVLTQKILKPNKVLEKEIIDEIGDVIIRLEVLKRMYSRKKIMERINYKLNKYKGYIINKTYNKF